MADNKNVSLTDLAAKRAEANGISKKQAEEILKGFIDDVKKEVKAGNKVNIFQFGIFSVSERAARTGRNPQTGETIQIAASKTPAFKASKSWKDELK